MDLFILCCGSCGAYFLFFRGQLWFLILMIFVKKGRDIPANPWQNPPKVMQSETPACSWFYLCTIFGWEFGNLAGCLQFGSRRQAPRKQIQEDNHQCLQFPNAVVLNLVGHRNAQMSATERRRAQKSAKGRKRALPRKIVNNQAWNNQVWELPTRGCWLRRGKRVTKIVSKNILKKLAAFPKMDVGGISLNLLSANFKSPKDPAVLKILRIDLLSPYQFTICEDLPWIFPQETRCFREPAVVFCYRRVVLPPP